MHAIIHRALYQAVREGLIYRNPADLVDQPREETAKINTFSSEQMNLLLTAVTGHKLYATLVLAWGTGARIGELLALKWTGVDLEGGTITITESIRLSRSGEGLQFFEPKTAGIKRTIPLPEQVVAELKKHKARQAAEKLLAGEKYANKDMVFATRYGTPIEPRNMNRIFTHGLLTPSCRIFASTISGTPTQQCCWLLESPLT